MVKKQKVEFKTTDNETLALVKGLIGDAVNIFVDAIPGVEDKMAFKAFDITPIKDDENLNAYLDVVMTELAIQIDEKAPKEGYTYNTSYDDGIIWLHASKGEEKEELALVEASGMDAREALVEVSGTGHLPQSNHIVYDA